MGTLLPYLQFRVTYFKKIISFFRKQSEPAPVSDPGLPKVGAPTLGGGVPTYDFAKFSQKLHEIERIWTRGGTSKILLCRFATELSILSANFR